jgi:processive 1,2-diacylglycerol beta-glucosyltransferase
MVAGSVLIVTAGFGEGHNAAARNLAAAMRESHPDMGVEVHDIFAESCGFLNSLSQWGYKFAINRLPGLWSVFFRLIDRVPVLSRGVAFLPGVRNAMRQKIEALDADVVVSCFPGYGPVMDSVRKTAGRPFTFVTVVTDSLTINSIWWRCSSDYFLVPNEPTARELERVGVCHTKVRVTGFPVALDFSKPEHVREAPPTDGLWKVLYMVNSSHHLAPEMVRELLAIEGISLTVTCGHNEALKATLRNLAEELEKPLELYGWAQDIPHLLRSSHVLITKAGGATVQEALAAKTPMIITKVVPGQEEGNARLVAEKGAGEIAQTPQAVAEAVRSLFAGAALVFKERSRAAGRLGHPTGARDVANFVASVCLSE